MLRNSVDKLFGELRYLPDDHTLQVDRLFAIVARYLSSKISGSQKLKRLIIGGYCFAMLECLVQKMDRIRVCLVLADDFAMTEILF